MSTRHRTLITAETSTLRHDRGSKFESYRRIESLKEYILIAQNTYAVEQYRKQPDGTWIFSETADANGRVILASIGCDLRLNEIYDKVDF